MKSFKEFLTESKETVYKIKDGETGPNKDLRYKETSSGWKVSKDKGETWMGADPDSKSPMYNPEDIEIEKEIGSIVKV